MNIAYCLRKYINNLNLFINYNSFLPCVEGRKLHAVNTNNSTHSCNIKFGLRNVNSMGILNDTQTDTQSKLFHVIY